MSLSLPKPNIEPSPGEALDEKRLREALKDVQRLQEALVRQVLAVPQDLTLRVGTTTMTHSSEGFYNDKEVEHGLGRVPAVVVATSSDRVVNVAVKSKSASAIVFAAYEPGSSFPAITVYWVAIG